MALPTGEIVERTLDAADEGALRRELEDKDLLVLDLKKRNALSASMSEAFRRRVKINPREFLFFNQEFSGAPARGTPDPHLARHPHRPRKNPVFKRALVEIRDRVKGGEALSDAFAAQGELFPKLYAASLASGERSGELPRRPQALHRLHATILAIQKKVVSALIYPAILMCASLILIAIMVFFVIPNFSGLFKDLGTDLPWYTQLLVDVSGGSARSGRSSSRSSSGGLVALFVWKRSEAGQVGFDKLKMKLPLVGGVIRDYAQNRFSRTLSTS
jgi:type IV pilus assembly protein PilC